MLNSILKTVLPIAEEAANLASSYFRRGILIETKNNNTPVTIADKNTETFIREKLSKHFPGHGICGEEFGEEGMQEEFVWSVDPIDGTRSFIRGIPLYGTLLGLLHRNVPVLGIMVMPELKETYWAIKGEHAYCNGQLVHTSHEPKIDRSFVGMGDYDAFLQVKNTHLIQRVLDSVHVARSYTDCFAHSLVIRGALDGMIDPVVNTWDIVPLVVLIESAGGECFNFSGERIWDKNFISTNGHLSESLLALVKT